MLVSLIVLSHTTMAATAVEDPYLQAKGLARLPRRTPLARRPLMKGTPFTPLRPAVDPNIETRLHKWVSLTPDGYADIRFAQQGLRVAEQSLAAAVLEGRFADRTQPDLAPGVSGPAPSSFAFDTSVTVTPASNPGPQWSHPLVLRDRDRALDRPHADAIVSSAQYNDSVVRGVARSADPRLLTVGMAGERLRSAMARSARVSRASRPGARSTIIGAIARTEEAVLAALQRDRRDYERSSGNSVVPLVPDRFTNAATGLDSRRLRAALGAVTQARQAARDAPASEAALAALVAAEQQFRAEVDAAAALPNAPMSARLAAHQLGLFPELHAGVAAQMRAAREAEQAARAAEEVAALSASGGLAEADYKKWLAAIKQEIETYSRIHTRAASFQNERSAADVQRDLDRPRQHAARLVRLLGGLERIPMDLRVELERTMPGFSALVPLSAVPAAVQAAQAAAAQAEEVARLRQEQLRLQAYMARQQFEQNQRRVSPDAMQASVTPTTQLLSDALARGLNVATPPGGPTTAAASGPTRFISAPQSSAPLVPDVEMEDSRRVQADTLRLQAEMEELARKQRDAEAAQISIQLTRAPVRTPPMLDMGHDDDVDVNVAEGDRSAFAPVAQGSSRPPSQQSMMSASSRPSSAAEVVSAQIEHRGQTAAMAATQYAGASLGQTTGAPGASSSSAAAGGFASSGAAAATDPEVATMAGSSAASVRQQASGAAATAEGDAASGPARKRRDIVSPPIGVQQASAMRRVDPRAPTPTRGETSAGGIWRRGDVDDRALKRPTESEAASREAGKKRQAKSMREWQKDQ